MNKYRYYREVLPEVNSIVIVRVGEKNEYGYKVQLLEYNIDGFVSLSELYRRKVTKKNILKEGDIIPLIVINVDNNFVTLSKNRLNEFDGQKCQEEFKFATQIAKIGYEIYCLYQNYVKQEVKYDNVFEHTVWRFYDHFDNPSDIWPILLQSFDTMFDTFFSEDFKLIVSNNFNSRIKKIKAVGEMVLNIRILSHNAIEDLKKLLKIDNFDGHLEIKCSCSPNYKFTVEHENSEIVINELHKIVDHIIKTSQQMFENNCIIFVQTAPLIIKQSSLEIKHLSEYELEQLLV